MRNGAQQQMTAEQANLLARSAVLAQGVDMWQSIYTNTLSGDARGQVVNVPVRNVGLIKKFVVEISGNITQAAAETLTRSNFGGANVFSNITFTDLSNQTRINTSGWHIFFLASARHNAAYGASYSSNAPANFGGNYSINTMPTPVTTVQGFRMFFEIPISYSDVDLRGAVYANVVNATMNLQLTINPSFIVSNTANSTLAVYSSSSADVGSVTGVQINIYQNYLDQLPVSQNGPILPVQDLSTAYLLNNTTATGLAAGQDFAIPYANFRNFMSTFVVYDDPAYAGGVGGDVNYWSIQSANYTNIIKMDPYMVSLQNSRNTIRNDFPSTAARSVQYFDHRKKPISTIQYGNMQLIANPSNVGTNAQMLVGYEALALINMITQAGSLYNT